MTRAPKRARPKPQMRQSDAQGGVSDALGFQFDRTPLAAPSAERGARGKAPDGAKPHFHDHRKRLRARFAEAGPQALADYELLELFLFRSIPRADVKPLAKALIARFGTLAGVLGAEAARIAEVPGAGEAVALDLKATHALLERVLAGDLQKREVIGSWTKLLAYCRFSLAHEPREQFRTLFLDTKNRLIADEALWTGTHDGAAVYPRELVRRALELSAANLILVHNHPSGDPTPSAADLAITREIITAAKALGIGVIDHVVIGRDGAKSFKAEGLM